LPVLYRKYVEHKENNKEKAKKANRRKKESSLGSEILDEDFLFGELLSDY
jgi:hypothetical protein